MFKEEICHKAIDIFDEWPCRPGITSDIKEEAIFVIIEDNLGIPVYPDDSIELKSYGLLFGIDKKNYEQMSSKKNTKSVTQS